MADGNTTLLMKIMRLIQARFASLLARWWVPQDAGAFHLIIRLLREEGGVHWRGYATAIVFMAIGAGCTSLLVYLAGQAINYAYVNRSFQYVAFVSMAAMVISAVKGLRGLWPVGDDGETYLSRDSRKPTPIV